MEVSKLQLHTSDKFQGKAVTNARIGNSKQIPSFCNLGAHTKIKKCKTSPLLVRE